MAGGQRSWKNRKIKASRGVPHGLCWEASTPVSLGPLGHSRASVHFSAWPNSDKPRRAHIHPGGRPSQAPEAVSMCFHGDIPSNTGWALIRSRSEMQIKATSCSISTSLLNPDIVYFSYLLLLHKLLPNTHCNKAFASQESGYSFCESFGSQSPIGGNCLLIGL